MIQFKFKVEKEHKLFLKTFNFFKLHKRKLRVNDY